MQAFGLAVLLYVMGANESTSVMERSVQRGASTAVRNAIIAGVAVCCIIEIAAFITAAVVFHNVKEEVGPACQREQEAAGTSCTILMHLVFFPARPILVWLGLLE